MRWTGESILGVARMVDQVYSLGLRPYALAWAKLHGLGHPSTWPEDQCLALMDELNRKLAIHRGAAVLDPNWSPSDN
jgi:myo-inositol catabolism protein IolC